VFNTVAYFGKIEGDTVDVGGGYNYLPLTGESPLVLVKEKPDFKDEYIFGFGELTKINDEWTILSKQVQKNEKHTVDNFLTVKGLISVEPTQLNNNWHYLEIEEPFPPIIFNSKRNIQAKKGDELVCMGFLKKLESKWYVFSKILEIN